MRTPIFIRSTTEDERRQIQAGLRSSDAFVLRRCQVLLASARGEQAPQVARELGCDDQEVRNVIHGFNASWHLSKIVRTWIREHNQQVKQTGKGVRILPFQLPTKSPWLNPIEPKWVHGKRAVVEPARLLSASELAQRICAYFGCSSEPYLCLPHSEKVS